MNTLESLKIELKRMKEKRNRICIELGCGYDWLLVDSLFAIDAKINKCEKQIEEIEQL